MALTNLLGTALQTGKLKSNNRNGGGSVARITIWNNGADDEIFLFSSGQATYTGGSNVNREYLKPGSVFVFLMPGQEAHSVYLANEEDGVSYSETAMLMVELEVRLGLGANSPKNLMPRLLAGEGRVFGALEQKETPSGAQVKDDNGNLVPEMVKMFEGEVPFPNGEIFSIRVLPPDSEELKRAEQQNKATFSAWIPLDQEKLNAILTGNREEASTPAVPAPSNPLARKKGTAIHKAPKVAAAAEEDIPF